MLFITSHKVRQSIANILGLKNTLELIVESPKDLKETVLYIKKSALILDEYTRELTRFIEELKKIVGNNKSYSFLN